MSKDNRSPQDEAHVERSADGSKLVPTAIQTRIGFYEARSLNGHHVDARSNVVPMDEELSDIERTLAYFRRRRNCHIRASTCPPEVLSTIFLFLAAIDPNYHSDPEDYLDVVIRKRRSCLGWIKATHVCHSWRAAAYADGRLWSTVTTSFGMSRAEEMIRLSKGTPLSLDLRCFGLPGTHGQSQLPMIVTHLHRLARLQILCDANGSFRLSDLCKDPAPKLEALTIFARERGCALSADTFAGQMPLLRELYLHNVFLPWDVLPRFRLTKLTLTSDEQAYTGQQTIPQILAVIAESPDLELVCLKNHSVVVTEADIPNNTTKPISCPHLTDITLHPTFATSALLIFCRLSHHPDACVSIAGDANPFTFNQHWSVITELFRERMKNSPLCAQMQTVEWRGHGVAQMPVFSKQDRVDPVYERTLVLSAWRWDDAEYLLAGYDDYNDPPKADFKLALGFESPLMSPEHILPWPQPFSSARNVSLQMSQRYPFSISNWTDVVQSFPHVKWLRVNRALAEQYLAYVKSCNPTTLPKSLKTLVLLEFFRDTGDETNDSHDAILANAWRETRKDGGALREIVMSDANIEFGGLEDCIKEAGVVIDTVFRPDWLREGHEDWDDLVEW
ncbi:hypothetical protein PENSPDRAFT_754529, partial [Peniophora sp. CONT]